MGDYFTHFSCQLEVGAANIAPALALYAQMARDLEADDGLAMGFAAEASFRAPAALWLHDEDHGEPEHVIAFALRCAEAFDLKGRWGFCWALTCSWRRRPAPRPWGAQEPGLDRLQPVARPPARGPGPARGKLKAGRGTGEPVGTGGRRPPPRVIGPPS